MVMVRSVEGLERVFGKAEVENSTLSGSSLQFIFCLSRVNSQRLRLSASNFHSETWQKDYAIEQLEDLRDDMGIGGSWDDFLAYLRSALTSDNVKLVFGGLTNASRAASAKIVAQKAKGTPRLSLPLQKLEESSAEDAMSAISLDLYLAFRSNSFLLASEQKQIVQLDAALATEKVKSQKLQEQLDSFLLSGRKRRQRSGQMNIRASLSQVASLPVTTIPITDPLLPSLSGMPAFIPVSFGTESNPNSTAKPSASKGKVHVAPAVRRAKRRGTAIADSTDS